ncbi:MAG TPA: SGNH/GDSL hydrolase family protein [bacterium]|nr:SGNH/GDSL hydrolase family protein [bacterium]HNS48809.1 SGNH/GDSL hydrolase family protein [bacterium]
MNLKKKPGLITLLLALALAAPAAGGPPAGSAGAGRTPLLRKGDRLLMTGDSITFNRKYSPIVETYLLACHPQLEITCFQSAIYGENTDRFLKRMQATALDIYRPTVATTAYGMNDGRYGPYQAETGAAFLANLKAIARTFQQNGCRPILGSPGLVGPKLELEYNQTLKKFNELTRQAAAEEKCGYADIHGTMREAWEKLRKLKGDDYDLIGRDGVHADWNGQMAMATAFIRAFNLPGEIGRIEFDLKKRQATANEGHAVLETGDNTVTLESRRYPYCFLWADHPTRILVEMRTVAGVLGFFEDFNRFTLVARNAEPGRYRVTWEGWSETAKRWGGPSLVFDEKQLKAGVNLAREFDRNPFTNKFLELQSAVATRQEVQNLVPLKQPVPNHLLNLCLQEEPGLDTALLVKDPVRVQEILYRRILKIRTPIRHRLRMEKIDEPQAAQP